MTILLNINILLKCHFDRHFNPISMKSDLPNNNNTLLYENSALYSSGWQQLYHLSYLGRRLDVAE